MWGDTLPKNRFLRFWVLLAHRYLKHNVATQSAALAFYLLFLHETGKRVRSKLRVVVQGLVILEVDVCLKCCLFCLCCFPVRFQLMAAVALF